MLHSDVLLTATLGGSLHKALASVGALLKAAEICTNEPLRLHFFWRLTRLQHQVAFIMQLLLLGTVVLLAFAVGRHHEASLANTIENLV